MADTERLLEEIRQAAQGWREAAAASPHRTHLAQAFLQLLERLWSSGWNDALGWTNELPDELLPQKYLERRAGRIDELEQELARYAEGWRRVREQPAERAQYQEAYADAMEELFRIGHWSGEPDWDSQLPDDAMPEIYKEYWRRRLRGEDPMPQ